jgi:hypothetical protein
VTTRGTALTPQRLEEGAAKPPWATRLRTKLSTLRARAPFNWPPRRKKRWALALLLLLLAYPVLVTVALWTGLVEWVLKSEDLRVEIENPAYTIWPGRVHMKHVRILANGTTQFILDGHDLLFNVRVVELIKRRVHVTELSSHDVTYQMRVQVKDTKGIEERVRAYPTLSGLPGTNAVRRTAATNAEKKDPDWTVQVEGLDVAVKELWFFEYRYLGKGHLRGGFMVGPHVMEVTTAVQDLGPGEVHFGPDEVVAKDIRGQVTADIPRLNPSEHADAGFMQLVTARVNLRADVQSLRNLSAYAPGIFFSHGAGPLALDVYLDRGQLGSKSHLDFETASFRVKGDGFGVGTDFALKFDAAGSPERLPIVQTSSKSTYVSLARGSREVTVQLHGHTEEARLDTIQLSRATDLKSASVRMPDIRCVDLRNLGGVLPPSVPVEVRGGTLAGSLKLDMDSEYWTRGPLELDVSGLELEAAGVKVAGKLALRAQLRDNPKLGVHQANMTFTARDVGTRSGEQTTSGWWADLVGKELTYRSREPSAFDGVLSLRTQSLEPALEALADKKLVSDVVPTLTKLSDFRAGANIHSSGPVADVSLASESDVWDVAGRVRRDAKGVRFAVVVGGQAVSLGVADLGDGLELMPFAKSGWLNEKLSGFPKPIVRMQPDKP